MKKAIEYVKFHGFAIGMYAGYAATIGATIAMMVSWFKTADNIADIARGIEKLADK